MNNFILILRHLFVIAILSGCSGLAKSPDAPMPKDFARSSQEHLQAVEHWSIIAQDMANQTIIALDKHKLFNTPIYVKYPPVKTEFSVAFHDFLIDGLVKKGVKVNRTNANNTVLEYKVQAIEFNSRRDLALLNTKAESTALASGILVVRDVMGKAFGGNVGSVLTSAMVYDYWMADGSAPKLELLISSSIVEKNVYLMKTTDIYYANLDDKELYEYNRNRAGNRNRVFDDEFYIQ